MPLTATTPHHFAVRGMLPRQGRLLDGAVVVRDGRIEEVLSAPSQGSLPARVFQASYVFPGLVDLQTNGAFGVEVGVEADALATLSRMLPRTGVTSFLPTLVSRMADVYPPVFAEAREASQAAGARSLGLHLEGPFLAQSKVGAHSPEAIASADDALFERIVSEPMVRLVTLAPEREGGLPRIARLIAAGKRVALGHSAASFECAKRAFDAGATLVTHLFNAMAPFHHRAPGLVGAALVDRRATVSFILDEVHAHPAAFELALRIKGPEGVCLVTDAISAAGMSPGQYSLGGLEVSVDARSARLPDGTLAGSVLTLDAAVRNAVAAGAPILDAMRMASQTPAELLEADELGRLEPGAKADLTLWTADLHVSATLVDGKCVAGALG